LGRRVIGERFTVVDRCTMPAAVTKSLLDRLFFSRFELQNWKKIFVEDFHKYIFFVLVCGPFLLIENFLTPANRFAVRAGKWAAFLRQSLISDRSFWGGSTI